MVVQVQNMSVWLRSVFSEEAFDDEDRGEDAIGQFQTCAGEESKECSPSGAESLTFLFAAKKFANQSAYKRPENHTQQAGGTKGKPHDGNAR